LIFDELDLQESAPIHPMFCLQLLVFRSYLGSIGRRSSQRASLGPDRSRRQYSWRSWVPRFSRRWRRGVSRRAHRHKRLYARP